MAFTRLQAIDELLDAEQALRDAWDALTTAVVRQLEGWDDPESLVTDARQRLHLTTGVANAALDQALAKAGMEVTARFDAIPARSPIRKGGE